jgi:nicotinamidase-related amidase
MAWHAGSDASGALVTITTLLATWGEQKTQSYLSKLAMQDIAPLAVSNGFDRVFLAGLAFNFCVRYSAEDAHLAGFGVVVAEEACRGIDVAGSIADTRRALAALRIPCVSAEAVS